jgi:hypothetical protein
MEIIVGEVYQMYLLVQNFMNNISPKKNNFIKIVENFYEIAMEDMEKNNMYTLSRQIYENSIHEYIIIYDCEPPKINFDNLYN